MRRLFFSLMTLTIVIVVTVLLILGTELLLRARDTAEQSLYQPDDAAIARYKAGVDRLRDVYGQPIRFFTNRHGIRHDRDLAPEQADVLVFGDSNVAALFLPFEQTLGQRLAAHLGRGVAVLDLGIPGYGLDQSVNRFKAFAPEAKARAVVLHFFADNDFGDLFRNNLYRQTPAGVWETRDDLTREPALYWEEYRLVPRLWNLLGLEQDDFDRLIAGDDYYPAHSKRMGGSVMHSPYPDALQRWKDVSGIEYRNYLKGMHGAWNGDHYDYGIASDPKGAAARTAVAILTHVLAEARLVFRGRAECLVMLIQPAEDDLMDYGGTSVSRLQLRRESPEYHPRALVDLAIGAATRAGIRYLDLFPEFSAQPRRYYYNERERPRDNHWNAEGVEVAARRVAEYLKANRCL